MEGKKKKKNWSQNHLWCLNDPRDSELDDDDNKVHIALCKRPNTLLYSTKKKVWHIGYTRHCHTVIVVNTVIYLLMFWVPLSINTYQKGNSCRFYPTRPAILVTVMSSFFFNFFFFTYCRLNVFLFCFCFCFVCLFVCFCFVGEPLS